MGINVERNLNAENTFTNAIGVNGAFNFSISGTFVGTITIQRSFDNGVIWLDMETYTTPYEDIGILPDEHITVRAGIKTGDYTSGTALVRISRQ
jgi:hypothetical protein